MLVHTLEEVSRPLAHPRVDKRLGRLNVVMEVVTEGLNVRDDFVSSLLCQMAREKDC